MKLTGLWFAAGIACAFATPAMASLEMAQKGGCTACHTVDKKLVGPAYKDVAAKYKGQGDAAAKLAEKVRKGGVGVWGPIPMPPNGADKINDADLTTVIAWILKI